MKKTYETVVIFDGTIPEETLAKEQASFEEFLKSNAELTRVESWGKRVLAYTIKKKKTGYYVSFIFDCEGKNIANDILAYAKTRESIVRPLTVIYEEYTKMPAERKRADKGDDDKDLSDNGGDE